MCQDGRGGNVGPALAAVARLAEPAAGPPALHSWPASSKAASRHTRTLNISMWRTEGNEKIKKGPYLNT